MYVITNKEIVININSINLLPPQETIIFWASENELIITYTH